MPPRALSGQSFADASVSTTSSRPIAARLAEVRRSHRIAWTLQFSGRLGTLVLGILLLEGWLDRCVIISAPLRALILAAMVTGSVGLARKLWIGRRWQTDTALALRLERSDGWLPDQLASSAHFESMEPASTDAAEHGLRLLTLRDSLRHFERLNLSALLPAPSWRLPIICLATTALLLLLLAWRHPDLVLTAALRLGDPYGTWAWPPRTQIEMDGPARVAKGASFESTIRLHGEIPSTLLVEYADPEPHQQSIGTDKSGLARFIRENVLEDFRYRAIANDAVSDWTNVSARPAPVLVTLDGRRSPQVKLRYPAYTKLTPSDWSTASDHLAIVSGTWVEIRAATDRPLARAWLASPAGSTNPAAAAALLLGGSQSLGAGLSYQMCFTLLGPLPARLDVSKKLIDLDFEPLWAGAYELHFEDEEGIAGVSAIELHPFPDPAPSVTLERPAASSDILELVPDSELTVRVAASDPVYGVRNIFLECQPPGSGPPGIVMLMRALQSKDIAPGHRRQLVVERVISAKDLRAGLVTPQIGDVWSLRAAADDEDDVTLNKSPGYSRPIELHFVTAAGLRSRLDEQRSRFQEGLEKARASQAASRSRVTDVENRLPSQPQPNALDRSKLSEAETFQEQVKQRLGTPGAGLRQDVRRQLSSLRANHLPPATSDAALEVATKELDRLADQEMSEIEPRLARSRMLLETSAAGSELRQTLATMRRHQEDVENSLRNLAGMVATPLGLGELKSEARALADRQELLAKQAKEMDRPAIRGQERNRLTGEDQAALDHLAEAQAELAVRASEWIANLERSSDHLSTQSGGQARRTASEARHSGLAEHMTTAADQLRSNQLSESADSQDRALRAFRKIQESLEDRHELSADVLRKKLKEAEQALNNLADEQDRMRKKMPAAGQHNSLQKQDAAELARQQEVLKIRARALSLEMAQLHRPEADQDLARAIAQMEEATSALESGSSAALQADQASEHLRNAADRAREAAVEAEQRLQSESQMALANDVGRLRARQEGARTELARLHAEARKQNGWSRALLFSMNQFADGQTVLAADVARCAVNRCAETPVFANALNHAADAMKELAGTVLEERRLASENQMKLNEDPQAQSAMDESIAMLRQIELALHTEESSGTRANSKESAGAERSQIGNDSAARFSAPQLKLLRYMQSRIQREIERFNRDHPGVAAGSNRARLVELEKRQQEVANLFELLIPPERQK